MPGTFMNYPFDEEIFLMQWAAAQDPVKLAMLNSGAVVSDSTIAGLISNGSNYYTMPFYNVIGGDDQNYDGETDMQTSDPTGSSQSGVVYGRMHGWNDKDFIRDFGNNIDPMQQIASQVDKYWNKKKQARMLKILDGVFGSTDNVGGYLEKWKQHTMNLAAKVDSAASGPKPENLMGETTMGDALQQAVGDMASIFSLCWMHSYVANKLAGLQLLTFRKYTDSLGIERQLSIADYNGMTVIVDDDCPVKKNETSKLMEYTTYAMGVGALRTAPAPVDTPVEIARDAIKGGGKNMLLTRLRETIHPNGFNFKLPVGCKSPTDVQLGTATNWGIAVDPKLIPMVKIVTNG